MSRVYVVLDDLFNEGEKKELIELYRRFDITGLSIIQTEYAKSLINLLTEIEDVDIILFKDASIFERLSISIEFVDELLKSLHTTGYILQEEKFVGELKPFITPVVVFTRNQKFCFNVKKDLGDSVQLHVISEISDSLNIDEVISDIAKAAPAYVIVDLDFIMGNYDTAMELFISIKNHDLHIWIPQLDFDTRVTYAKEVFKELEDNFHENVNELLPSMMS